MHGGIYFLQRFQMNIKVVFMQLTVTQVKFFIGGERIV